MMNGFETSNMSLLHYFLGLEVGQAEDEIFVSQRDDARDLVYQFGMLNCKLATPMNNNEKLLREFGEKMVCDSRFRSLVGGLIYLTHIRPNIAFSIAVIYRFMHQPTKIALWSSKEGHVSHCWNFRVQHLVFKNFQFQMWVQKLPVSHSGFTATVKICWLID